MTGFYIYCMRSVLFAYYSISSVKIVKRVDNFVLYGTLHINNDRYFKYKLF